MFAEIKKYKSMGLNKSQVERKLQINYKTVNKYWNMNPEEFAELRELAKNRTKKVDKYKDEILTWIEEYRDLSAAQIYDWLLEKYKKLDFKDRTLRKYVNNLRMEHKLPKVACIRQYEEVAELPMGYQAQVDLGQIWVPRVDGTKVKVYCFAMVLSHSRYKFLWWTEKPFTTQSFIDAHNKAFEFFGGMTKEIVYDQDRILVVSENNGDIVYTEGFQNYLNTMKFKMRLCRAYDPESKGKVEAVVKYAKYNFARHRTFIDIDSFNEDSFKWLKRTGNAKIHDTTKKVPAEVFALEKEHLKPAPRLFVNPTNTSLTYGVRKNNTVLYKQNRYQVPKGTYTPGKEVELVIKDSKIDIVDRDSGEIIVTHKISTDKGKLIQINHPERDKSKTIKQMYAKALNALGQTENGQIMLDTIKEQRARYCKDQFGVIINTTKNYDELIIKEALEYCTSRKLFSAGLFKDTLEYLNLKKSKRFSKKHVQANNSIPSKYQGVKPEIRNISDYTNALKEDKKSWIN